MGEDWIVYTYLALFAAVAFVGSVMLWGLIP
jgi:hypothetical protein